MTQTTPRWKAASDKISELRDAGKENSVEFHLAYAEYFDAMAFMKGDSNGYYWSMVQKHKEKARQLEKNN